MAKTRQLQRVSQSFGDGACAWPSNALALLAAGAVAAALWTGSAPARAATYKWVDEKGVTNYSSAPPRAATAKSVATVEERISIYPSAPLLREGAALERRQRIAEAEWLQRQRLMLRNATYTAHSGCYGEDCYRQAYRASRYYPLLSYPVVVRSTPRPPRSRVIR